MDEAPAIHIDTSKPHSARIYDYILGGKTNYPADHEAAQAMLDIWAPTGISMRVNRDTMHRMARWLAKEAGIRQFLDIGTGIPTPPNLHEIVQHVAPESRIVYVDNDPIVLAHARALLVSTSEGRTTYIEADMRDPRSILDAPELRDTLDLTQPVAATVIGMLQYIEDAPNVVGELVAALPAGSYLALTTATADFAPEAITKLAEEYTRRGMPMYLRTHAQVEALFDGLELVAPGVVPMHKWHPAPDSTVADTDIGMYAGVARIP